jgi:2-keto-3-deoxy-L-rhamnonate aldolase RhmA
MVDDRPSDRPSDRVRAKLARDEPVIMVNPDHPSPSLVAALGRVAADAVFIDCEQGSADVETVENMARAARLAGVCSLVRLFCADDWAIERYLGRGIDGIVVPRLEQPQQAAAVVAAVRYCDPGDEFRRLVVVQIETRAALDHVAEFLAVDGIDGYFIGPVDLAKSLGFKGDYRAPAMQAVLAELIARIRTAGRTAGILVDRENVQRYVAAGVRLLYTHADGLLAVGAQELVGRALAGRSASHACGKT